VIDVLATVRRRRRAAAADSELDPLAALSHALEIATVPEGESILADVAHYIDAHGCTVAEAYHLAYADGDPIVSPNERLDRLTDERISVHWHTLCAEARDLLLVLQ